MRHSDSRTELVVDQRVISKERAYSAYSVGWTFTKYTSQEIGEIMDSGDIPNKKRHIVRRMIEQLQNFFISRRDQIALDGLISDMDEQEAESVRAKLKKTAASESDKESDVSKDSSASNKKTKKKSKKKAKKSRKNKRDKKRKKIKDKTLKKKAKSTKESSDESECIVDLSTDYWKNLMEYIYKTAKELYPDKIAKHKCSYKYRKDYLKICKIWTKEIAEKHNKLLWFMPAAGKRKGYTAQWISAPQKSITAAPAKPPNNTNNKQLNKNIDKTNDKSADESVNASMDQSNQESGIINSNEDKSLEVEIVDIANVEKNNQESGRKRKKNSSDSGVPKKKQKTDDNKSNKNQRNQQNTDNNNNSNNSNNKANKSTQQTKPKTHSEDVSSESDSSGSDSNSDGR